MTPRSSLLVRAAGALVVLGSSIGWTTYKVVTKERAFEGSITVWHDSKLPNGKSKLIDEFRQNGINFKATVAELAGGKEVTTNFTLNGKSQKGRVVRARLTRPARMQSDLKSGKVELDLPIEWTVDGKVIERVVMLSTDKSISGPNGPIQGKRMSIRDHQSPIVLVGEVKLVELEDVALRQVSATDKRTEQVTDKRTEQVTGNERVADHLGHKGAETVIALAVDGVVRATEP